MNKRIVIAVLVLFTACLCVFAACDGVTDVTATVSFDANGGSIQRSEVDVALGSELDLSEYTPTRSGYEFVGWTLNGESVTSVEVTDNVTVVASWKAIVDIVCDVETAEVVNDRMIFDATAVVGEDTAACVVTFNGEVVEARDDGRYVVDLQTGANTFVVSVDNDGETKQKTYAVQYDGFSFDLPEDVTTGDDSYVVEIAAKYGDAACETEVSTSSGATATLREGNSYTLKFTDGGVYAVNVKAVVGNKSFVRTFDVNYDNTLPRFKQMTLASDKEYRGEKVAFNITATDADGSKLNDSDIGFFADTDADDGKEEYTELTSTELNTVWSDSVTTSFALNINDGIYKDCFGTKTLLKVVLTDGDKSVARVYGITYIGADVDGCVGEVVLSIDGFTVGSGYILQPTYVKVYKDVPFPQTLNEVVEEQGWTMDFTGSFDSGFYLSALKGLNIPDNHVDERLKAVLEQHGTSISDETLAAESDGTYTLEEFCYTYMSGWMYCVNGVFANYGASDYTPIDGDVVQWRFTLAYGMDIGGSSAMGMPMDDYTENNASYIAVNKLIAEIRAKDYLGKGSDMLENVLTQITAWDMPQSDVDNAYRQLTDYYFAN